MKIEEGQDHLTYLSVLYSAEDTEEKWKAISDRKQAYMES